MLVWQTLVATPISSPWRRQASSPSSVLFRTCIRPRRSSLTISEPSMLMSGVTLPSSRERAGDVVGDQLAVGEDLEVAVGVRREQVEQLRVHERLAAENAEVGVAVRLGVADDAIQLVERELLRRRGDVHPAALAAQLTARDHRDEQERRKVLAAPAPPLVQLHRAHALDAEVVDELRHDLGPGLGQHAPGQCDSMVRPSRLGPAAAAPPRRASRAASAFARISSGDGSAASTSAGMSRSRLQRDQAVLPLLQRAVVVALLGEARLRLGAAIAQHRVDVAAEQRRDVHLHRLAAHVVGLHLLAVDRAVAILREHDRDFGADARAGRAIGLAVALVLDLNLAVRRHAVDVEQAEAQALHAVGAARVVDHREPGLPGAARPAPAGLALERRRDASADRRRLAGSTPCVLAARHLEPAFEEQPRQRGAVGRRSARAPTRSVTCERRAGPGSWRAPSVVDDAASPRLEQAVDDGLGRLDAHVPDAHGLRPAAWRRPTRTATSPRADSRRRSSAARRRRARAAARRRGPPSRTDRAPRRTRRRPPTGRPARRP